MANVLLVDDRRADIKLTLITLFERPKLHCHLHTARDGGEAYKRLSGTDTPIDLMLLDINMPGINGFELLEQLQGTQTMRHTSIVMCSGSDHEPDRKRALRLGAIDYLLKPPRFEELKSIIDRVPALKLYKDGDAICLTRS